MRTSTFFVSLAMVLLLVGCGLLDTERQLVGPDPHPAEPNGEISAIPRAASDPHRAEPVSEVSKNPTAVPEASSAEVAGEVSSFPTVAPDPHPAESDDQVSAALTATPETALEQPNSQILANPPAASDPRPAETGGEVSMDPTAVPEASSEEVAGEVSSFPTIAPDPHPEESDDRVSTALTATPETALEQPNSQILANPPAASDPRPAETGGKVSATLTATLETALTQPNGEVAPDPFSAPVPHPAESDGEVSKDPTAVPEASSVAVVGEVSSFPTVAPDPNPAELESEVSAALTATPEAAPVKPNRSAAFAPVFYEGPTLLEERILTSPVIAKVRLDSASSTVELGTTYRGMKHIALLEFNFSVLEYLKGSGADDILAVWADSFYDTRQEAQDALSAIAAARDDRWDDRDAIVFLQHSAGHLPSTQQAGRFYLSGNHLVAGVPDDYYSLASRGNKLWLPADAAAGASTQSNGDQQRFLMDLPPATGTAPTITLGQLKTRISAVIAKLAAGDGSEEYRQCVQRTYSYEGQNQYRLSTGDEGYFYRTPDQELASGLPFTSVVLEKSAYGGLPNVRAEVWLEGADADLFSVVYGDSVPHDFSGDGEIDSIRYVRKVVTTRPLPEATYTTDYNRRDARFVRCEGYSYRHDWTITVNAPEGTLHEAFFDPVTDGTAVAADDTNGVLKPASFTGVDGAAATIERIEWESGTVKLEVSPHTGLSDHIADFIALDGSVHLSLKVADATADAANNTLSWAVALQPWEDGDELMLRIREVPDCSNGTVVPNPSANSGLVTDCVNLLAAKDTLRGAATLNWSVDTAITSWDGVKVQGSPGRVTELALYERGLTGVIPPELGDLTALERLLLTANEMTGTIPPELGDLTALEELLLSSNELSGTIPSELGGLTNLRSLLVSGNQLSGTIPPDLGGLTNLRSLWLHVNQLSGSIPPRLGGLTDLEQLGLSGNRLTGAIPSELGDLFNLETLWLNNNQLTGEIPAALGNLSNLQTLSLANNQLTGCIPPSLRNVGENDLNNLGLQDCATP